VSLNAGVVEEGEKVPVELGCELLSQKCNGAGCGCCVQPRAGHEIVVICLSRIGVESRASTCICSCEDNGDAATADGIASLSMVHLARSIESRETTGRELNRRKCGPVTLAVHVIGHGARRATGDTLAVRCEKEALGTAGTDRRESAFLAVCNVTFNIGALWHG
jgi:hypothetical protein